VASLHGPGKALEPDVAGAAVAGENNKGYLFSIVSFICAPFKLKIEKFP
jgi:hypothetical protein